MGLLDLLKSQPKWKHPDAAVRLSAIEEISGDDQDVLYAIAQEDEDSRVRRAATERLARPAALAEIARSDGDGAVRDRARDRLIEIAHAAQDETSAADLVAALQTLSDVPLLAPLAKQAPMERIARGAFDRLRDLAADAKVFASIARQSPYAAIRTGALLLLGDERDFASVALRTEYKDTGLAAIERVADREQLEAVAARAKNKVVSRRARAVLREQDQRAHQQAKSEAAEADARRQQALGLCRAAETLRNRASEVSEASEWTQLSEELRDLEGDWRALDAPRREDEALAGRFQAAADAIRHARTDFEQRRALEEQRAAERAQALAARQALYERLQALPVPEICTEANASVHEGASAHHAGASAHAEADANAPARTDAAGDPAAPLSALSAAYEALGPARDREAAAITEQFHAARHRWLRELERRRTAQAVRPQLEQILQELDRLATEAVPETAEVARLHKAWARLSPDPELHPDLISRASETQQRVEARLDAAREARAREERANLARINQLCARLEAAATTEGLGLRHADRLARDARAAIEQPGPFASKRDRDAAVDRLKQAYARLAPRLKELREADEWQRWANAGVQEELCRRAEALLELPDVEAAWRQSRELFAEWKKVAAAPRDRGQALWMRFKAAEDRIRDKCDAYFAQQAQQRAGNAARKLALVARAEALADATDWIRTADEIKRLQAEWKTVGPVPRGQEKAIWDRFRTACDRFFTRRHDDLVRRKQEWAANLARKEALCAQAEALLDSTDWDAAAADIKRFQAEWKTRGPVRKNKSEAIWQRFRTAIDRFYERYHQRHRIEQAGKVADREGICAEIEDLGRAVQAATIPRADLVAKLRGVRGRWAQAPVVSGVEGARLEDRYASALDEVLTLGHALLKGTEFDVEENQRKMERLCKAVEGLADASATPGAGASPVSILAAQLREALAANTIGGRVSDENRWRASLEEVRRAQAAWRRLGPVPRPVERQLSNRFRRACNRFFDEFRRKQATA